MSASSHTYLGPYFCCKTRTVSSSSIIAACANTACTQHGVSVRNTGFCPRCGTAIDFNYPIEVEATEPRWSEVSEAIREALTEVAGPDADFGDGFHIWVPNVDRTGEPVRPDCDHRCGVEVPIDGVDIEAEKCWLAGAFAPELPVLLEAYGEGNVVVRWGLLRYCL